MSARVAAGSVLPTRKRARVESSKSPRTSGHSGSSDESSIDDTVGHLNAVRGDMLLHRYEVQRELGVGTFGKVYKCFDTKHKDVVAIKVVRKIKKYVESARIEAAVLSEVYTRQKREGSNFIVKLYSHQESRGFYYLVFERLGVSLYDFLKKHRHAGLPLHCVREIAWQLLAGVAFLHSMRLIHTDLKLENVLLVDNDTTEYIYPDGTVAIVPASRKIKIIDFGGATYEDERKSSCVNTRQYRGPEVILETGWSYPSDVWGVGCMIAEVYTGDLLFATHGNLEHLALMETMLGPFPQDFTASPVCRKYFHTKPLRVRVEELSRDSQRHVQRQPRLEEVFSREGSDASSGVVELLRGLLQLSPDRRSTAKEALSLSLFFPVADPPL